MHNPPQIAPLVDTVLAEADIAPAHRWWPISGGCINDCYRVACRDGREVFVKYHPDPPANMYRAEAAGLHALREARALRVPAVLAVAEHVLVLEFMPPPTQSRADARDFWECFATGLARLHTQQGPHFGFHCDNYCGATPQINTAELDGHVFFSRHRLGFQARRAQRSGLLSATDCERVFSLANRLSDWIPEQPPVLLHGDLWQGNIYEDAAHAPALIDPACYWGWAEADIAMTTLFGSPPAHFFDTYCEHHPLAPGWRERLPLYNLYHLLNHLNLFGGSYLNAVQSTLRRFV